MRILSDAKVLMLQSPGFSFVLYLSKDEYDAVTRGTPDSMFYLFYSRLLKEGYLTHVNGIPIIPQRN